MGEARSREDVTHYVWTIVLVLRWIEIQLFAPVVNWLLDTALASVEELSKACLREIVGTATRALNGASYIMARLVLGRAASQRIRRGRSRKGAVWRRWWKVHDQGKAGTFNALLVRDGFLKPSMTRPGGADGGPRSSRGLARRPQGSAATSRSDERSEHAESFLSAWYARCRMPSHSSAAQEGPGAASGFPPGTGGAGLADGGLPDPDGDLASAGSFSEMFVRPAGEVVSEGVPRRGFLEEIRLAVEVLLTRVFSWIRMATRRALMLPTPRVDADDFPSFVPQLPPRAMRASLAAAPRSPAPCRGASASAAGGRPRWKKPAIYGTEDLQHWTVSDVIIRAGYPLETHIVQTADGYLLTMQRIPRKTSKDAVFFQHGVLDTSLTWVSNGMQGSQAFAAYDAGFDVWLGNSRANPPLAHVDRAMMGARYWHYSINELGMQDLDAEIDHVHRIKTAELTRLGRLATLLGDPHSRDAVGTGSPLAGVLGSLPHSASTALSPELVARADVEAATPVLRRSASDTVLVARRNLMHDSLYGGENSDGDELASDVRRTTRSLSAWRPLDEHASGAATLSTPLRLRRPPQSARDGGRTDAGDKLRADAGDRLRAEGRRARTDPALRAGNPYRLQAVGHSLGGASLLMYAVQRRAQGKPHRLSRMILLSPAGFHKHYPRAAWIFLKVIPGLMLLLSWLRPGLSCPVYIPSSLLRYVTFKLTFDLSELPALQELFKAAIRTMLSGDNSEWDRALQMPHYNEYGMPALSLHTGAHLVQLINSRRWRLYDYGTAARNMRAYGTPEPPDVAAGYHLLRDLPIDLIGGRFDGIVSADDVHRQYQALKAAGVTTTYREFRVGHLDLVFAMHDGLQRYVLSRLLVPPAPMTPTMVTPRKDVGLHRRPQTRSMRGA